MPLIEKLVIASRNPAKVEYYRRLFMEVTGQIVGLSDLGIKEKPNETSDTAEGNCELKAKFYSGRTTLPIFCEDEALYADFLPPDKQPGTHVRRINSLDEVTDDELFTYWENIIKSVPIEKRTGRWHIAYCLAQNGRTHTISTDHEILFFYPTSKIRIPGWPMSSLEGSAKLGKPNSERTEEEKQIALFKEAPIILETLKALLQFDHPLASL